MKCKRKSKNEEKTQPKGISIEHRTFSPDDRTEFGHWEGDTIVGSNKIENSGAVLTLVERKTSQRVVTSTLIQKII